MRADVPRARSSSGISDELDMIIGMSASPAAPASTRSPRYADSALMPIGAMPNADANSRPRSVIVCDPPDTLVRIRGTNHQSRNAARLSASVLRVSAASTM